MSQNARKFFNRSPRYQVGNEDDQFIRFVHQNNSQPIASTQFLNISATGLAFVTEQNQAPGIGDKIKIEFPIPGFKRIAWWATVARLVEYNQNSHWMDFDDKNTEGSRQVIVGVRFDNLPKDSSNLIKDKINDQLYHVAQARRRAYRHMIIRKMKENLLHTFILLTCGLLSFAVLWYLSQPTSLNDIRNTPWSINLDWSQFPIFRDF